MSQGQLSTMSYAEAHISGLPCETKNEANLMVANCDHTIKDFVEQFNAEKLVCPTSCKDGDV